MTGDNISTEAVKNIIKVTKAGRKKLQRVHIAISLKGIVVTDLEGNDILKISIYRSVSSPSSAPELTCPIAESRIVRRIPPTGKYSLSSRPTPTRPWSATLSSVRKERWRRRLRWRWRTPSARPTRPGGSCRRRKSSPRRRTRGTTSTRKKKGRRARRATSSRKN